MKSKYIAIIILAVVAAGVSIIALQRDSRPPEGPVRPTSKSGSQPDDLKKFSDTQTPKGIVEAHNAFGIDVFKEIAPSEQNNNIFISPTSIALALSMVYNGAGGDTKTAMAKVLRLQGLDLAAVNQQSAGLMQSMQNPDPNIELAIANSVWAKGGIQFNQSFLDTVAQYFKAKTSVLDFNDPRAVNIINSWVSENTNGKIPTILDSISPTNVMFLINAVYFKGSWTYTFDKTATHDEIFHFPDGSAANRPFMNMYRDDFQYFEDGNLQSISLPYGKNRRLAMNVFLPKENLGDFVKNLNQKNWNQWMSEYRTEAGAIALPKFKVEYKRELNSDLTALGMGVAFGNQADFSGIGNDLLISKVVHKTYVDVNEEGTEAAAVTEVGVDLASTVAPKTFYMEVNKPFFFAITDTQTGEILFMGIVQNP